MSAETERLREQIRTGEIQCLCRHVMLQEHFPECAWIAAVNRVYFVERAEEEAE